MDREHRSGDGVAKGPVCGEYTEEVRGQGGELLVDVRIQDVLQLDVPEEGGGGREEGGRVSGFLVGAQRPWEAKVAFERLSASSRMC